MQRPTTLGAALFLAALKVTEAKRPATIANNIVWRGEHTKSGVKYEPSWQVKKEGEKQ